MSPRTKTILRWAFCILAAAALVYGLCAGLARPADPTPMDMLTSCVNRLEACQGRANLKPEDVGTSKDCSLTHEIPVGKPETCPDHVSVPYEYLAELLAAQDTLAKRDAELRAEKENHATDVERLEGELAGVQKARQDCEASRVCPRCPACSCGLPIGISIGVSLLGGIAFDHWALPCR